MMIVIPGSRKKTVTLRPKRYNANLTIQIIPNGR
jgi:hypothetical protein